MMILPLAVIGFGANYLMFWRYHKEKSKIELMFDGEDKRVLAERKSVV